MEASGRDRRELSVHDGRRGQQDLERRSAAELRLDEDVAAALLDDAVGRREPETRSLADLLRA